MSVYVYLLVDALVDVLTRGGVCIYPSLRHQGRKLGVTIVGIEVVLVNATSRAGVGSSVVSIIKVSMPSGLGAVVGIVGG